MNVLVEPDPPAPTTSPATNALSDVAPPVESTMVPEIVCAWIACALPVAAAVNVNSTRLTPLCAAAVAVMLALSVVFLTTKVAPLVTLTCSL